MDAGAGWACETDAMTARARVLLTLEGYAVEGGLDVLGGPATCYAPTIALGRQRGPGEADALWERYDEVLDLVPGLGVDGVRLTFEWARLEPRRGVVDDAALARYVEVVAHARSLDLAVTVALVDAAWPSWLGLEAWLLPWVAPVVVEHARRVVAALADPAVRVVDFTEPEALVLGGYLRATRPPWRRRASREARFARAQLRAISDELAHDEVVGPRLVTARPVSLDEGVGALREARGAPVDEVHVRSLLAGHGPTRVARGVLVRDGGAWRVEAPELLAALA